MIESQRAHSLDALRGIAILLMVLSGILPHTLPAWMFHAQVPPGQSFNPLLPGITWVDLVFPFFLFALGAAMPFAFERRRSSKRPFLALSGHVLERGFLLVFFAVFVQHIRPYTLNKALWGPETAYGAWLLGMLGFVILFAIYVRLPDAWPKGLKIAIKLAGWTAALLFLYFVRYPDGSGFDPERMDIIIMLLANMVVFASLIYLLTRNNIIGRLAVMAVFIAMRLVHMQWDIAAAIGGQEAVKNIPYVMHLFNGASLTWIDRVWNATPAGWLYHFSWLKYLLIVLPGTIAGDQVRSWMKERAEAGDQKRDTGKLAVLSLYALSTVVISLIGLYSRSVFATTLALAVLCLVSWLLLRKPGNADERFLKSMVVWGSAWILIGLVLEPFGGGIKKDNSTLSYYFLTSGLACMMIVFLSIWIDILKKKACFKLLIHNGQNPMIAYVGMMNLLVPLLYITHAFPVLKDLTAPFPWLGFLLALGQTLLLALIVSFFTRKKIFWRT